MAVDVLQVKTSIKGRSLKTLRFSEREVAVGRDASCGVVFDNPGVSRRHAVIALTADGVVRIVDQQSSNGTYVNGRRVTATTLSPDDRVDVGKFSLQVSALSDPRAAPTANVVAPGVAATGDRHGASAVPVGGTVVLGAAQRARLIGDARESAPRPQARRPAVTPGPSRTGGGALFIAFAAGCVVGALLMYLLT